MLHWDGRKPASANPQGFDDAADYFTSGIRPTYPDPLAATRGALPISQRFPVVIYAPSFSSNAWENADLCEYLASFGYVVIASPGMGVQHESTHDLAGANAQAQDISFLTSHRFRAKPVWFQVDSVPGGSESGFYREGP
jgi:dienelactone hydrolase